MNDSLDNSTPIQIPPQLPVVPVFLDTIVPPAVIPQVSPEPNTPPPPQQNNKLKPLLIIGISVLLLLGITVAIFASQKKQSAPISTKYRIVETTPSPVPSLPSATPTPTTLSTPTPSKEPFSECNSPLAPSNVRPHVKCYYRSSKISFAEAKAVEDRISKTVGSINLPKDMVFVHQEVYRGIPIKWTSGQPISPNVLVWLKAGLDALPDYFYVSHPLTSIISATDKELGSPTVIKPGPDTLAFASGLNIFLTETTAKGGTPYYPADQNSVVNTLFHEWVHVVQHYEALQTFTEEYLAKNTIVEAMATGPLEKGFAKEVGWVYNSDEFGDGMIAKLKSDAQSQKTTEYGRTKVREDMAESGALFLACKSDQISEARTLWWEKITGKKRTEFCPSKI